MFLGLDCWRGNAPSQKKLVHTKDHWVKIDPNWVNKAPIDFVPMGRKASNGLFDPVIVLFFIGLFTQT